MPSPIPSDPHPFRQEIRAAHERARDLGIDPGEIKLRQQAHLSPEELTARREANRELLEAAFIYIRELYRFVEGMGFLVGIVDRDGFVLDILGDTDILRKMQVDNRLSGSRWTERDVGTSAISLVLHNRKPIQITAEEHFCKQSLQNTCSAAPVYDKENQLIGAICLSGKSDQVHPHTLGMVITAARAVENHIRMNRTSRESLLKSNYMNAIIESIDSGVMAVNKSGIITQINHRGKQILDRQDDLMGKPLSAIKGLEDDRAGVIAAGSGYADREIFIRGPRRVIQLVNTARPIFDSRGRPEGIIFVFNEINRIRKLVNRMAGSHARFTFEDIIGVSAALQGAKKLAMLAAGGTSSVLLLGETGTGKELFAQSIHNRSERQNHPFVAINCGAIPRGLLESELFGYVEGAFTGARKGGRPGKLELAHGGTVFLDEVGDMPADMQVKLLRVLQSGEIFRIGQHQPLSVDLRIIAASHFDLKEAVDKGNFREDLFYRLNVLPIAIPALREREGDTLILARHILKRCALALRKEGIGFSSDSERTLTRYSWPGNVRELENVVERAVNLVEGPVIEPAHFGPLPSSRPGFISKNLTGSLLEETERETIKRTLEETRYNISRASFMLGISRTTLYKRLKKYRISLSKKGVQSVNMSRM